MASSKEYKDFVLDNLHLLDNITCRPMMGEYLLYYNKVLFGGIYDDRLLIKRVDILKHLVEGSADNFLLLLTGELVKVYSVA